MSNQVVVIQQQKLDPISFGFVPVMILCGVVALVITYFWQILFVTLAVGGIYLAHRWIQVKRQADQELADRAVTQNQMFLAGDVRGTVGVFDGEEY